MSTATAKSNRLIHETSPYLLQHAYNPVDWHPFTPAAFELAQSLNKPLLISIGYSACHWCHVMEHESFEDPTVAAVMNEHFVCVKVDREERPDADHLYMQAVQLMTGHGGWPLNCFVLPDGKPFYGGTYFPKEQWIRLLTQLSKLWQEQPERVTEYAMELTAGIRRAELISISDEHAEDITAEIVRQSVERWKQRLDDEKGGPDKAPKFPLPNNYLFLLRYALLEQDHTLLDHVNVTLRHMALGGLYDQLHGGFARYSTDKEWKVPHFEKMLYDNAQLVSLYSEAWLHTGDPLYKKIVEETLAFMLNNWKHPQEACFFSATDADSEGEEGKYYVWTTEEIEALLASDAQLFSSFFGIGKEGYWEHGNNVLMHTHRTADVCLQFQLTVTQLEEKINKCKQLLRQAATNRVPPGIDDKTLMAWNAMAVSAFARAWMTFGTAAYKTIAVETLTFLLSKMKNGEGLFRTFKNETARIPGFLDDYAFLITALMDVHQVTAEEKWLHEANRLCNLVVNEFSHDDGVGFYYTSANSHDLVERTSEMSDNVIPASNSQMALNLFYLSTYFHRTDWAERARNMLARVGEEMKNYGAGYSNWAILALHLRWPYKEIAIVGKTVEENFLTLYRHGLPNAMFALSANNSDLPFLQHKTANDVTKIYICENGHCELPCETIEQAFSLLD
jgi:uncharacterized protein YyaL (SSP411 family)